MPRRSCRTTPRVKVSAMRSALLRQMAVAALLLVAGSAALAWAADAPPPLAGSQTERDAGSARLAAEAIGAGHLAEAAGILETLVAPRHHMLTIGPGWHRDLARAYAALGLIDGAQGQYRLALAGTAGDEGAADEELAALIARAGRADVVPDTLGPNGAKYFDLRWVDRGNETIDFGTAFVLPQDDADSGAFTTATYRADCLTLKSQLLGGTVFSAAGKTLRSFGEGEAERPANDLADHSLRMVCRRDPALQVKRVPSIDGRTLLTSYRAQRLRRTAPTSSPGEGGAREGACRAHVEMFVGQLAADGQVSGPSWQVRDWWDMRTEDLPKERLAAATSAVEALARADPGAARAFQQACVQGGVAGGSVPGL